MGCSASKPWKNKYEGVVGAYQFDERDCGCGSNEFKLVEEPKDIPQFASVKDAIEPKLAAAVELVMENKTRGCCCDSTMFDVAVSAINQEWAPDINKSIASLGYAVDAFAWKEWQYNGQTSYEASYFCIRVKEVGVEATLVKED